MQEATKMNRTLITALLAMTVLSASAPAQEIRKRQENQQDRIAQGVASGQLTPRETARIERQEATLNRKIRRDRKDGAGLTARERRNINRRQNRLSKEIGTQKHDPQRQ
jgi:hypothetical protein